MVKGGRFHENLEIHKQYQKRGTKKRQKDVTGWEFLSAGKTETLIYLQYMLSKPVSTQCYII